MNYRLTPKAQQGFLSIVNYVYEHFGPIVGGGVVDQLEDGFKLIASNPGVGHSREDLTENPEVLFWSVGPTLIAYRAQSDVVEILFVERGSIDWAKLIGSGF